MGAASSAYEGCFGDTKAPAAGYDRQKQHESPRFSNQEAHRLSQRAQDKKDEQAVKDKAVKNSNFPFQEFDILKILGKGGFGRVYLVKRKSDKEFYALKSLKKQDLLLKNVINCSFSEKNLLKDIEHPFILHIEDCFQDSLNIYLLTNFCAGGNLLQRLKKEGKFNEKTVKFLASEIILAIQYVHENLSMTHRDLKLENILLASDGHIKITDFGLSKTSARALTSSGTLNCLAPEIILSHTYSHEVDWWSLGCLIYHMLVGRPLFENEKLDQLSESIIRDPPKFPVYFSNNLNDLLTKLLKKKPKERLGSKGADEIKNHAFFKEVDWGAVLSKQVTSPLIVQSVGEELAQYLK